MDVQTCVRSNNAARTIGLTSSGNVSNSLLTHLNRRYAAFSKGPRFNIPQRDVRRLGFNGRSVLDKYTSHVFQSMHDKTTLGLPEAPGVERAAARLQPLLYNAALYIGGPLVTEDKKSEDNTEQQLQEVLRALAQVEKRNSHLRQDMQDVTQKLAATASDLQAKLRRQTAASNQSTLQKEVQDAHVLSPDNLTADDNIVKTSPLKLPVAASSCVVQHPGAMCCTEVAVAQDLDAKTCTVTVRTVARCTDNDASSLTADNLMGLATQALLNTANEVNKHQTQHIHSSGHPEEWTRHHHELQNILQTGKVVNVQRNDVSEFGHESFLVDLEDVNTKRRIKALFKPRVPGDADGWHRVPIELVAYELNVLLGMDYVPPVGYRTGGVDVNYTHFEEGAFIYFCNNTQSLCKVPEEQWGVRKDVLLSDTRILDVLLHNSDRHHGHFLVGEHWVEGRWKSGQWKGTVAPMLIDHAAGFRPEASVTLEHENAFQTGPVRCISAKTYLRLRFLDAATITSKFGKWLDEKELRALLHRRNMVLKAMDELVQSQGYANTVLE